ncbi:MAG: hypothetical protein L3J24_11755 [Xanthomonadales bacterium]|nr:hypothetical protein [Xanthomonadales bacterium]
MRNRRYRSFLTMLLLSVLSACVTVAPYEEPQVPLKQKEEPTQQAIVIVNPCVEMLSYYEMLKLMPVTELEQRQTALWESVNHTGNGCDQLRLAVLLGLPELRLENDVKAEGLIKDFLEKEAIPVIEDKQIAWFLMGEIQWRKKIQSNQQALRKQQKQERVAYSNLLEQLSETQLKLEQLIYIDKNINAKEREISIPSTDKIPSEPK